MKHFVLVLALSIGCGAKAQQADMRYAFPKVDGKQYMTLQVAPDRRLVIAVDRLWSCTGATCEVVPPDDTGNLPTPGNCPCHITACSRYCDPDGLKQLPQPQTPEPTPTTTRSP